MKDPTNKSSLVLDLYSLAVQGLCCSNGTHVYPGEIENNIEMPCCGNWKELDY